MKLEIYLQFVKKVEQELHVKCFGFLTSTVHSLTGLTVAFLFAYRGVCL